MAFIAADSNWVEYRELPNCVEVDFHWSDTGRREIPYWEAMEQVEEAAFEATRNAWERVFLGTLPLVRGVGRRYRLAQCATDRCDGSARHDADAKRGGGRMRAKA